MLIKILTYFNIAPDEAIYVGDSELDEQAADAALAVVAAEDQHFPDHSGFDLDALQAAARALSTRSTLPSLGGILLTAEGGAAKARATDTN